MKKVVVWLMVAMMAVSVCGCGFSDGVKDGMEAAANKETETEGATEEQTEVKESESVPETEAEPEEETPAVSEEQEKAETAQAESINVLMTAPVTEHEEKNDTKWAEIVVDKELLKATTNEEFAEFCNEVVNDSGYNWVTISCGDGTGIQFQGSLSYLATYGTIDTDGCIEEAAGMIVLQEDGTYKYSENE